MKIDTLYSLWCGFCHARGNNKIKDKAWFGRDLRAVVPGLSREREATGERDWFYHGVGLNEEYANGKMFEVPI